MSNSDERYTELNEQAQRQQEKSNQMALEAVRAKLAPQTHPDFDGKHCIDCPDLIPFQRLAAGRIRCVRCQEAHERLPKFYRR